MSRNSTPEETPRRGLRQKKYTEKFVESQTQRRKPRITYVESDDEEDEDFSGEEIQVQDTVSSSLAGAEIYSFNKVRKHERVITAIGTPKKNESKQLIPKTPHNLRKCLGKAIQSAIEAHSSDDDPFEDSGSEFTPSESSGSESCEEEETGEAKEESSEDEPVIKSRPPKKITPSTTGTRPIRRTTRNQQYHIKTEEYFSNNATKKATTSNHTLDRLETPRLSQEQLQRLLAKMSISHDHEHAVRVFSETARDNFNKWMCLLHENFSLLLYGLGSKINVLKRFHQEMLKKLPVIVINGFFPSLTLKDIFDAILQDVLEITDHSSNVFDLCDIIEREFESVPEQHLYLIIHNIDGDMLRNNKSQSVLARLASIKNVHLIASIDHINAPLIWDHSKLSKFNFVWWDVTSYLSYNDETSFESSMMVQRTGNLALSSLRNVFLSLTSNSKGIYLIILKYQLEHNTNQYYQGLLFKDLYGFCREAFLVSTDLALKTQLTEFIDHKMVKIRRSADGGEYLIIPIVTNLLQQFLNEQS